MQFLVAAAVLLASYGAGVVLVAAARAPLRADLRGRTTAFALGFGLLALLAFALGRLGAFDRGLLAAVVAGAAVPGLVVLVRDLRRARAAWRDAGVERWILAAAGAILALDALVASAPPTSGDAIGYHLAAPKLWLEAGRITDIWWNWPTFQPFAAEMHYAYAEAIWDGGRAAMVVAAGLSAFSAVAVYGFGRELAGPRVAALAVLLWVGQGMFLWEATGAFVEPLTAGLIALAGWHLAVLARTGDLPDAAWAGVAAALAAGTKYFGLLAVAVVAVLVVVLAGRTVSRRAAALALVAVAFALAAPWYVKNWLVTGNPVYPLLWEVFGGKYWNAASQSSQLDHPGALYEGVDGIWHLPALPIEFVLRHERFERGYSISPALFVFAPLALLVPARWVRLLAALVLGYLVLWFEVMHQIPRYLVPMLPLAAVLAALAGLRLWERGGWPRRFAVGVAGVTAAAFVVITGAFAFRILPGALGLEPEGRFVQRLTGTYDAFRWIDRNLPDEGRVFVSERNLYWLDRPHVRYSPPLFSGSEPPALLVRRLRAYDVRYLALVGDRLPRELLPLRHSLEPIARLPVPYVTSRTLGRVTRKWMVVYRWCGARTPPRGCGTAASP